jgi:NAD(P)-dependent dehydrogenase (short-subunit alcohol dehydrogenase family)
VASVDALPTAEGAGKSAYAAAKSAVLALMRAVAAEERDAGVRANAVAPGTIRTAANVAAIGADARYVEREAVADALVFLCSEEARGVTGQTVRVE